MTDEAIKPGQEILLADHSKLICERIVRLVSGKRLVCTGVWQQQQVYAKIFRGKHAARHASREKSGWQLLSQANILTPALLHEAMLADGSGRALLYEAIDARNAEDDWCQLADDQERLALMRALTATVAAHHAAGLLQTDLYFKNFLVRHKEIYTLDCDGIRCLRRFCRDRQTLHNLAMLFSKMDVTDEHWIPELYRHYCQHRDSPERASELDLLQRLTPLLRMKTADAYADRKVFRNCSDVAIQKDFIHFQAVARDWVSLVAPEIATPDTWLDTQRGYRLKSGNTCTLSMIAIGDRQVVVKRYNIKNFRHGLNRALRSTRAAACWANAHRLAMYGIAHAAPIALLEKRVGPFRRQAYFLAEYINAPDVTEFFADSRLGEKQKAVAAQQIADLFHKLYRLKIKHGDCKASNIKMPEGKPLLLDLDSMRQYRCDWLFARVHARDLRRLMRNWQHDQAITNLLTASFRCVYQDATILQRAGLN